MILIQIYALSLIDNFLTIILFKIVKNQFLRMISILMPAKNAAKYIQETIISIQNQTLSDRELIVVDDHSVDETNKIG